MSAEERCWYTLDAAAQPVGPYNAADLIGFAKSGMLLESQVFWKEGKPSWDKLADVPELEEVLKAARDHPPNAAPPAAAAAAAAAAALEGPGAAAHPSGSVRQQQQQQHHHHQAVISAKPSDPLEAFKHEIAAVEADEAAAAAAAAATASDAEQPQTPDELEFEDDDGTMYQWDHKLRKYVPAAEAEAAAAAAAATAVAGADDTQQQGKQQQQQHGYDIEAMTFVAEEEIIPTLAAARAEEEAADAGDGADRSGKKRAAGGGAGPQKKTKQQQQQQQQQQSADGQAAGGSEQSAAAGAAGAAADDNNKPAGWFELKVNTSVYVTGLPADTDTDEVAAVFSKCGIIKLDDNAQPKIKLYRDKGCGDLKGDGLVTYLKEPSVQLACQILDGATLRPGSGPPMSVTPARFEMKGGGYVNKKQQQRAAAGKGAGGKGGGGGGGRGGGGKGGRGGKGKKRGGLSQADKLEKKLGWGGFDDALPYERVTVVLKHMFSPDEAAAGGASFAAELEGDVLAECAKLGTVEKVRVFAGHPQGIVTVRFKQEEPAQACLQLMNGRFFGGQQLVAHMWDGFTNYNVKVDKRETAEEEAARLEAFARELEQAAKDTAAAAAAAAADAGEVQAVVPEQEAGAATAAAGLGD